LHFTHPVTSTLTIFYHAGVIELSNAQCVEIPQGVDAAAVEDMKIYLLMMLMCCLFAAIHFTSAPQKQSETLPQ
jgi:hypothetical protein